MGAVGSNKTYTMQAHYYYVEEEKIWIAEVPELSCATQGDTEEEVISNIKEAISCCMESLKKLGVDIPIESDQEKEEKQGYKELTIKTP